MHTYASVFHDVMASTWDVEIGFVWDWLDGSGRGTLAFCVANIVVAGCNYGRNINIT